MSYSDTAFWGLPDPDTQSEFYADVPVKRAIAWVIDGLIIFAMGFLIALFTVGLGFFFFPVLLIGIGFIYRTVTLANRSATLGMRLASIELGASALALLHGGRHPELRQQNTAHLLDALEHER